MRMINTQKNEKVDYCHCQYLSWNKKDLEFCDEIDATMRAERELKITTDNKIKLKKEKIFV